jgi:hypothetical protein
MTHSYNDLPPPTPEQAYLDVRGEQSIHEVNGGDRHWHVREVWMSRIFLGLPLAILVCAGSIELLRTFVAYLRTSGTLGG